MRNFIALLPLIAVLVISMGCAKKEASTSTVPPSSATDEANSTTPPSSPEHVEGQGERVSNMGSANEIMERVADEEAELQQIIANAKLNVVHQKAFAIRDLVVASADKATVTGADKAKLSEHVNKVKSLASELDEAGDAGNLSKTKAAFMDFQAELEAIRQILASHR